MARGPRIKPKNSENYYHIISRTAGDVYISDDDKFKLLNTIFYFSNTFFFNVISYCIMGNHFHLIVRSKFKEGYSKEEQEIRLRKYFSRSRKKLDKLSKEEYEKYLNKLEDISAYVGNIKQDFARWYNKTYNKRGFFWGGRFKNPMICDKKGLLSTISYVELNPLRAKMINKPEDYSFSSIYCRKNHPNRAKKELSLEGVFDNVEKLSDREIYLSFKEMILYMAKLKDKEEKEKFSYLESLLEVESIIDEINKDPDFFLKKNPAFSNGTFIGKKESVIKLCKSFSSKVLNKRDKNAYLVENSDGLYIARKLKKPK